MSSVVTRTSETHAGRPRDDQREQAILDAACELLIEVGYDQLSLDTVATRARASKATIYRRWSNKAEVVAEAIRRRSADKPEPPDCGSIRADLLFLLTRMCDMCSSEDGALVAGVVLAMRNSPDLAEIVRTNIVEHKQAVPPVIIERAIARGELTDCSSNAIVNEVMLALVFSRMLVTGEPLDESFAVHAVDEILIPLLMNSASPVVSK